MAQHPTVVTELYRLFNERRLEEAAALFAPDAVIEYSPLPCARTGGQGFLDFARIWLQAFPEAQLAIEAVHARDAATFEFQLVASGAHLGPLDLDGCGTFQPSGAQTSLRLRQLFEVRGNRIAYSALSFDLQEFVAQLVVVDASKLIEHLRRVDALRERLQQTQPDQVVERRAVIDRLGAELDAARRVVRPYFHR